MLDSRTLLVAVTVLVVGLAGCIGADDDPDAAADATVPDPTPEGYVPLATGNLSQPVHDVEPRVTERISVNAGDVDLFVEYWLPDGEGPFPTVVHSTPYSHLDRSLRTVSEATGAAEGNPEFFAQRGYAYVVVDVRGFGESEGCVEVWGPNEQADQAELVEWVAEQEFSDGNVGMIGASYPGTTPIEAAVEAPEPLEAIVAVAGLTDPYYDWHYGGVPNGESGPAGSPAAYQGIGSVVPHEAQHGQDWVESVADNACGTPSLVTEAYQTDGVYTEFYEERNLTQRVDQVEAAVLYTQGFEDGNVKPSQALNWFNELDTEKKGLFGPWGHTYPPRDDWTNMSLAWFDEHLKDEDTRVMEGPTVEVHNNLDRWRPDEAFPTQRASDTPLFLGEAALSFEPAGDGDLELNTDRTEATARSMLPASAEQGPDEIVLETEALEEDVYLSGVAHLALNLTLEGAENAFLDGSIEHVTGDEASEVTYGALNLALDEDVTTYEPVATGEPVDVAMRFQPVEHVFEAGDRLRLVLEPVDQSSSTTPEASGPSTVTIHVGGEEASRLSLPLIEERMDQEIPEGV